MHIDEPTRESIERLENAVGEGPWLDVELWRDVKRLLTAFRKLERSSAASETKLEKKR